MCFALETPAVEVDQKFIQMNQVFMLLYLLQNYHQLKKIRDWFLSKVLPSIRKYGQYKLFDNPNNRMFKIKNETGLHCRVVQNIRRFYPEAIIDYCRIGWKSRYTNQENQLMEKGLSKRPAKYYDHELPHSIFWALY